jgi:hypothetical protein
MESLIKFFTPPRQRRTTDRSNHPTRAPDREPADASNRELRTIFDDVSITPPETSLALSEIEEMAKTDGIDLRERIFRKDDPEADAHRVRVAKLCFLYAKKLFVTRTTAERNQIYEDLAHPGHTRMNKLFVTTGDKTFDEEPAWQSFPTESDPTELRLWAGTCESDFLLLETNMGAFTVFAHHKITIKQRRQLSRSCFLQAPIVLQAYLINKHTQRPADMIDMSKYVRHYLPTKCLEKYLSKGSGDSFKFLASILHGKNGKFRGNAGVLSVDVPLETEDVPWLFKKLKQFGPALITNFHVEEDFIRGTRVIFNGEPTFETSHDSELRHAMLLVGIRMDPVTGEWRLLLQNWWRNKQFIEVSLGYMAECEAKVYFIMTPQERMMSNVEHHSQNFAESTVDDGCDEDWDDEWDESWEDNND